MSSRAGSRATASRLGSARHFHELEKYARLGSLEAREPLRAEPSRSELEPARKPRAIFPALAAGVLELGCAARSTSTRERESDRTFVGAIIYIYHLRRPKRTVGVRLRFARHKHTFVEKKKARNSGLRACLLGQET